MAGSITISQIKINGDVSSNPKVARQLKQLADLGVSEARANLATAPNNSGMAAKGAPGRYSTGTLAAGYKATQTGKAEWTVRNTVQPLATWHESGTRAHGPVKAKRLIFFANGRKVAALWVRGILPGNMLKRATVTVREAASQLK